MPTNPPSIKPGTVADFAGSMAAAMEDALRQEYEAVKEVPMPDAPDQDRHLLFVAIAQGVVRHLIDNLDAIEIKVTTEQDESSLIKSHESNGDIVQIDDDDNRVISNSTTATITIQTDPSLY